MIKIIRIAYLNADCLPIGPDGPAIDLVVEASLPEGDVGANGVILCTGKVEALHGAAAGGSAALPPGTIFEDRILEPAQRRARIAFRARLSEALGQAVPEAASALLVAVESEDRVRLYHHTDTTEREMLALYVGDCATPQVQTGAVDWFTACLDSLRDELARVAPLLGTRRAYLQWRPDMELERKYTFHAIPDTWALEATLFEELYEGRYPGFFPEPHMGIQVFDYENHLFEVSAPEAEQGYISFIPQVDKKVTVKRKWFRENAEFRRESLWPSETLDTSDFDGEARSRVAGELRALPVFRRKRLDVNYESLATGHVFGVYFDICTTVDVGLQGRFGQVEVEYCRSRTLGPLADVVPEFEALAAHVDAFLRRHSVAFQHDLYSKLDFARDNVPQEESL